MCFLCSYPHCKQMVYCHNKSRICLLYKSMVYF
uniref:Uncharacterized protein n=1 Tax=Myoviridae sp. ctdyF5 TaxID=2825144 RepID=A0A8S5U7K9_9CAUD|nr:MAG TPA: hypothetical protein [Myoviridae sp. ctdyF5]